MHRGATHELTLFLAGGPCGRRHRVYDLIAFTRGGKSGRSRAPSHRQSGERYATIMAWFLLLASASPVLAQDWARERVEKSPRHREWVTLKHDGRAVETFVVYPESKDKTPWC